MTARTFHDGPVPRLLTPEEMELAERLGREMIENAKLPKAKAIAKGKGRPSAFSEAVADEICDLLSEGYSLVQICQREDMPVRSTVLRWMEKDASFATKCARAREGGQADYIFDDMAQLETRVLSGEVPPDVARVVISSKQWRAAKLAPKKYGDKTSVETTATVKVEHTRKLDISELSDDQLDALESALRATVGQLAASKTIEHE